MRPAPRPPTALRLAFALFAVLALSSPIAAIAAELGPEIKRSTGRVAIHLTGEIVSGDLLRMETKLEEIERRTPKPSVVLTLHSPGGDHFAGLRIALLLRRKGVATAVLPGDTCLSACSSIFFGGYDLTTGKPDRTVIGTARLGVHRMAPRGEKPVPEHVQKRVYNAAQQFLTDMDVSPFVQTMVLETDPKSIYMLSASDMLGSQIRVQTADWDWAAAWDTKPADAAR